MAALNPPTSLEIGAFLDELRAQRERLVSLAKAAQQDEALVEAIDAIGEHLLVADEELRVQHDQLMQSSQRLDLLVAAYEELFANAATPYVQTDAAGLIVRYNRAAARLLGLREDGRSRTLANVVVMSDRSRIRALINRLRSDQAGVPFTGQPEPVEVTIRRADGRDVPAVISVRRSREGGSARPLFHWEIQERDAGGAPAGPGRARTEDPFRQPQAMAAAAIDLARQESPRLTLEHVAQQALAAVPGCDEVGVTLVRAHGRVETPVATGRIALACDEVQYRLGEGPCLGAIDDSRSVLVCDTSTETRWPKFSAEAARLGVGSLLAVPLATARGTVGALNFYARATRAFDEDDELVAAAFATHAGIAVAHAELESNLRIGLQTREEIGRAVGILMERHRVTATAAFDMLVVASQHSHQKLRDVARWVNETGEDPIALLRRKSHRPQS